MRTKFVGWMKTFGTASGCDTREHRGRVGDEDVSLLRSGRHVVRVD
jgi:hypothetical protein